MIIVMVNKKQEQKNKTEINVKDMNGYDYIGNLNISNPSKNDIDNNNLNFQEGNVFDYIHNNISYKYLLENYLNCYGFDTLFNYIIEHLKNNKNILLYCDYDSDGMNSSINLLISLNYLKDYYNSTSNINIKYGNRYEGYGIPESVIKDNIDFFKKYDLLITADLGITIEFSEILKNNINVAVLDHHLPKENLDKGVLYVNPIFYNNKDYKDKIYENINYFMDNKLDKFLDKNKISELKEVDIYDKLYNNKVIDDNEKISAGNLCFLFSLYAIKTINPELAKSLHNFQILPGALSTITDVMPQSQLFNYVITNKAIGKFNNMYYNIRTNMEENLKDENFIYKINETLFNNNSETLEVLKNNYTIRDIIKGYLKLMLKQDKPRDYFSLGYIFGPYFNSFGRMIVPEILLYTILNGEMDYNFNELRKTLEQKYVKLIEQDDQILNTSDTGNQLFNMTSKSEKVNLIDLSDYKDEISENEEQFESLVKTILYWIKGEYSFFDNFYDYEEMKNTNKFDNELYNFLENNKGESIVKYIQEKDIEILEGLVGLIASNTNNGLISMVGSEKNGVLKCSGRSKINFEEIGKKLQDNNIINYWGGHASAFGIGFKKEDKEKVKNFIEEMDLTGNVDMDFVFNLKKYNIDEIYSILSYFNENNLFEAHNVFIYDPNIDSYNIYDKGEKKHLSLNNKKNKINYMLFSVKSGKYLEADFLNDLIKERKLIKVGSFEYNEKYKNYSFIIKDSEIYSF